MEKHKLDELNELLKKYDLYENSQNGKLVAFSKSTHKMAKLSKENMNNFLFAFSWAKAWIDTGLYKQDVEVKNRTIPGFDRNGKEVYDSLIKTMKNWVEGRGFHHYIDCFKIAENLKKVSKNPYSNEIAINLLRPDRLSYKEEFHNLFETGKITTELVNKDKMLANMYKYLLVEAGYKSEKGFQPEM